MLKELFTFPVLFGNGIVNIKQMIFRIIIIFTSRLNKLVLKIFIKSGINQNDVIIIKKMF